jgi:hypothetical protein
MLEVEVDEIHQQEEGAAVEQNLRWPDHAPADEGQALEEQQRLPEGLVII